MGSELPRAKPPTLPLLSCGENTHHGRNQTDTGPAGIASSNDPHIQNAHSTAPGTLAVGHLSGITLTVHNCTRLQLTNKAGRHCIDSEEAHTQETRKYPQTGLEDRQEPRWRSDRK
ncbi:Hypothetical predicted protein [Pelobates cultripes]|uniref:Uncharacterized protein n=1 Tax=Pelobates cultripes TaxID=61616 RepID=A0AAD1SF62_PELCU|nr:Hypothetical predicted protein [Pelobates cultripes]